MQTDYDCADFDEMLANQYNETRAIMAQGLAESAADALSRQASMLLDRTIEQAIYAHRLLAIRAWHDWKRRP